MYFHTCRRCGSNLDPGEICRCGKEPAQEQDAPDPTAKDAEKAGGSEHGPAPIS